ncbi:hypothetical protein [Streptomyces sp. Root369]|uniref:hypothetical protein n=1 Tax=Streptomyces sp. Root369 TaxID=1736523 RepID=UPI00070F61D2|nr:hypothetical protein [Streptomyces sp. Root369]KQW14295.1 hypothetical protein ASD08_28810 [Streptomyces sp. Root369]
MEQRIGSSSQPLEGAGFDPAFIPGLTSPVSGEAEEARAEEAGAADADEPTAAAAESEEAVEEEAPDGPVFEASDRRAKFIADHQGIRLSLDDQACEFRWDEIGAIETETPRFGKRFTITVHTPDRRWYPIEIEAESRARFTEWDEQLDAVMDKYFEDETPETKEEEPEESD